ncbi:MAG TPA: DUF4338 domain-containing protein [Chthoniobacterales bacterium]|nr:DUF4338 domain-containing protein [Chthoniobacterales bacterium]
MRRYCGRDFSVEEQTQIKELIKNNPGLNRTSLSREVCRMLAWYKADGGLKAMSCRVAMLRMQDDGLICLPSSQKKRPSLRSKPVATSATDPERLITEPVHQLGDISLSLVKPSTTLLWNEYIERYHYLGYTPLPGAQLRYFVMKNHQVLALLGFGASAWKVAPRDEFIGWDHDQRRKGLPLIVNNARFLILPWVQSKNLASKILAMIARQLPIDWFNRYNLRPVLMETFVETGRFTGTCYRAANWINVGKTKGRGKLGPSPQIQGVPIKDIFLYPLTPNFRRVLKS